MVIVEQKENERFVWLLLKAVPILRIVRPRDYAFIKKVNVVELTVLMMISINDD